MPDNSIVESQELGKKINQSLPENLILPENAHMPIISILDSEQEKIDKQVFDEVEKAALTTFLALGIDLDEYQKGVVPGDLVDMDSRNEKGHFTFLRKPDSNKNILVIVISRQPLYDTKGRETIALKTRDGKVFLNLRKIEEGFSGDVSHLSLAQKAGILTVEEVVHFIQEHHWHQSLSSTEDFQVEEKAMEHYNDAGEKEAMIYRRRVYDILYPELELKIRGIDYY